MKRGIRWFTLALTLASTWVQPGLAQAAIGANLSPADLEVGSSRQVIIVTAPSPKSRQGEVTAFEKRADGSWQQVFGPIPAMLGYSGLTPAGKRRQGTGKTPTGSFEVVSAFGRKPDPGTSLPYRQIDRNDVWTYDPRVPSTYNMMQTIKRSWKAYGDYIEYLWSYGVQYDYVAVLDYNLPPGPIRKGADGVRRTDVPANTAKGGGIFLHASNGKVTAGCISVPVKQMRAITRWLDPAMDPLVVIRIA